MRDQHGKFALVGASVAMGLALAFAGACTSFSTDVASPSSEAGSTDGGVPDGPDDSAPAPESGVVDGAASPDPSPACTSWIDGPVTDTRERTSSSTCSLCKVTGLTTATAKLAIGAPRAGQYELTMLMRADRTAGPLPMAANARASVGIRFFDGAGVGSVPPQFSPEQDVLTKSQLLAISAALDPNVQAVSGEFVVRVTGTMTSEVCIEFDRVTRVLPTP